MARPQKQTVDYFPHDTTHGKTMYVIESKFGNDGYAFWFKLLELLGMTDGHVYNYNNPADKEFLLAKTKVSDDLAKKILDLLAELDSIDKELWSEGYIWSDNFVLNISDAYSRRKVNVPHKPDVKEVNVVHKPESPDVNADKNTQSKVEYSKEEYSKVKHIWEFYCDLFQGIYKPRSFSDKRKGKIKQRLKNYSVDELETALKNMRQNKYLCGDNDSGKVYAKPEYCFRNDEKVEEWLNFNDNNTEANEMKVMG